MPATRQNSVAVDCVVESLDASGQPRKAFALDLGVGDAELSRAISGTNGARFDLGWLDEIPPAVALAWLQRYAARKFGARVLLPHPEELLARVLADVGELTAQVQQIRLVQDLRKRSA